MVGNADRRWGEAMPQAYERGLVATVFRPFAQDLATRIAARAPRDVLELAAGTGVLTDEILRGCAGTAVTATDLSAAMVDYGRDQLPLAQWQQADALDLPFGAAEFDVVACQFGVMFFPDKQAGFAEARRVLRPEGTLLFNTWGPLESHDFQQALVVATERVLPVDPPRFMSAVPHGYADPDAVSADLHAAGFECRKADLLTLTARADSVADLAAGYCTGTPLRAGLEARGDLRELTARIAAEMEQLLGEGPVTGSMAGYVFDAAPALG